MTTLLVSQRNFESHVTPSGHPERPDRLRAVEEALERADASRLSRGATRPSADLMLAELVHEPALPRAAARLPGRPRASARSTRTRSFRRARSMRHRRRSAPGSRRSRRWCWARSTTPSAPSGRPATMPRSRRRWGSASSTRSPSWRARRSASTAPSGWRSSISTSTTATARRTSSRTTRRVFYASSHQWPLYPGTGSAERDRRRQHRQRARSRPEATAPRCARPTRRSILPALEAFAPDILLISAGFDADHRDPLAQLNWVPDGLRLGHAAS